MGSATSPRGVRYHVRRSEALRYMGYAGQPLDELLDSRIDALIERCESTCAPGWTYRTFPVELAEDGVHLLGTTLVLPGKNIREHLAGARECAVMAITLGLANERELQRAQQQSQLEGVVLDACSSALAEVVADACNAAIVEEAHARGLYAKWRYSPGYGDLPLSVQPTVLAVVDAQRRLGITLTDGNLMIPTKSVTALVGLFDEPQDEHRTCANCPFAEHCNLRKEGTPCYQ